MLGARATLSVAVLLVAPVPPLVELTAPVVLVTVPDSVPVTFTIIVHVAPGVAMLPPVRLMLVELAAAVTVPPQVLLTPGVEATCNPLVNVSLNATPFSALVLLAGLVIVNVTVVVPFSVIFAAPNALLIVGGATTFIVAVLLAAPVPPSVELIAPVVLLASPSTVPFTSTLIVQDALWATLPPDRLIAPLPAVAVTVPRQVLVTLGVLDTTSVALPGPLLTCRVSLNATPLRSPLAGVAGLFGLLMVKVTVVVPFSGMLPAPSALLIVGGATTVTVAVAGVLAPASVELTVTLLFLSPAVVPCTFRDTVHEALAATVPPLRLAEPEPAVAVAVPPQVLVKPFGVATTKPAGRLSVNDNPVSDTLVFGLLMLMVSEVVPFCGILVAAKVLVTVAGVATLSVAVLLVAPVPPLVELTAPVVLVTVPDCVPVTFTTIVHVLPGVAMLPPVRLMLVELAAAVTVPPQVLLTPGVDATCKPLVNVSLNAIPFSALVLLPGLVIVNVTVVVPFSVIFAAPNALLIVGGATTFSVAVLLVVPVPPSVELIAPVVLLASPSTVPFTYTLIVQDALWATLPLDRLIAPPPAVAVTVPPQVLVTLGLHDIASVGIPAPPLTCNVPVNVPPVRSPLARVAG